MSVISKLEYWPLVPEDGTLVNPSCLWICIQGLIGIKSIRKHDCADYADFMQNLCFFLNIKNLRTH